MAATPETVSITTTIFSSALISALVNICWNAYAKSSDRKKEAAKDKHKIDHVYLLLILQMEDIARQCYDRICDISVRMDEYIRTQDRSSFRGFTELTLDFNPPPDWSALPVQQVAEIKTLMKSFDRCKAWIIIQSEWADFEDCYKFEEERLAYYALKMSELSLQLRLKIGAGQGDLEDISAEFNSIIDNRRSSYNVDSQLQFIPELIAHFNYERS